MARTGTTRKVKERVKAEVKPVSPKQVYQLVTAGSIPELEIAVNDLLSEGDKLLGGPMRDDNGHKWCQALVGPAKLKEEVQP